MLLCLAYFTVAVEAAGLELILYTNKPSYWIGDEVKVYGYLFYNSTLVGNGTVNLEVDSPFADYPILLRTMSTGTLPQTQQTIDILSLFSCTQSGTPKSSFTRGTMAYFNVTLRNNNYTTTFFTVTLSFLDSAKGIVDSINWSDSVIAFGRASYIVPMLIPDAARTGTTTVYANVFSKMPKIGGYAIAREKNSTFTVTSTLSMSETTYSPPVEVLANGQFYTNFTIPRYQYVGNYSIYVTTRNYNQTATNQKKIEVRVPDVNKDGRVNVLDLIKVGSKLGWTGPPGAIVEDVNRDGKVNILDLIVVSNFLGWVSPPT
jgi:hypothetical protein